MRFNAKWLPQNLLFFALGFVYLWLVVEPHLIYHCFGTILPDAPPFATDPAFLMDRLAIPGGGIAYATGFLSQGYYHAWLGAAIIVLMAVLLAELFRRHLALAGFTRSACLAALPAVAFFLLHSRYKHPLSVGLTVVFALSLSLAFEMLPSRHRPARLIVYALLAALAFWIGGAGTLLLLTILTMIYSLFLHRDWLSTALVPLTGSAIVWAAAMYVFLIPPRRAFLTQMPLSSSETIDMGSLAGVLVLVFYGFVPAILPLAFVVTRRLGRLASRTKSPPGTTGSQKRRCKETVASPRSAFLRTGVIAVLPILLLGLGLYLTYDELAKPYVLSNYYWTRKQWDKILELGRGLPAGRNNIYVNHDIIRALYHTGRLPYDLFCFPQNPQALLLTHERRPSDLTQLKLADIFLELGHVNMAEKMASELVGTKDHLGVALEQMAWISIVKEQPCTARVYLNVLAHDLIRRRRARSLLRSLEGGFPPDEAACLTAIRSRRRLDPEAVTGTEPIEQTLIALLERNPQNRMAFEYLMAGCLLTGQVDKLVAHITRLDDLGYRAIPPLYEEAILIYYGVMRQKPDLGHLKISPETIQKYQRFVQLRSTMGPHNRQAVLNQLIREFGSSYFFYFAFGQVGAP